MKNMITTLDGFIKENNEEKVELKYTIGTKIVEISKNKLSTFESLMKNIKRYCKGIGLPQPIVKDTGDKTYFAINYNGHNDRYIVVQDSITSDYKVVQKQLDDLSSKNPKRQYNIISQDVSVFEITIIDEVKPDNEWEILGVINHEEGIIISAPNKQVPFNLIPTDLQGACDCDHCNTHRRRNKTIYVKNTTTNEIKRVGGSCIKYYLGYDYDKVLNIISQLNLFSTSYGNFGDSYDESDWDGYGGGHGRGMVKIIDVDEIIKYFFWYVRNHGYISKATAEKYNENNPEKSPKYSTSNNITQFIEYISEPPRGRDGYAEWQEERTKYNEIISTYSDEYYALIQKFIDERYQENNFLVNSRNFFNAGGVPSSKVKYVVSACSMYYGMKMAEDAKNAVNKEKQKSEHVGVVGEKIALTNLTITGISGYNSDFGWVNVYRLKDEKGNLFTKFGTINERFITKESTIKNVEVDAIVSFTAEIKKHDVYNGTNQTVLGRLSKL